MADETEHIRHIEHIQTRYKRGDLLYSRDTIGVLLREIAILSERCVVTTGTTEAPLKEKKRVSRCEKQAYRGTGTGVCDTILTLDGYCPRWSEHLELVED